MLCPPFTQPPGFLDLTGLQTVAGWVAFLLPALAGSLVGLGVASPTLATLVRHVPPSPERRKALWLGISSLVAYVAACCIGGLSSLAYAAFNQWYQGTLIPAQAHGCSSSSALSTAYGQAHVAHLWELVGLGVLALAVLIFFLVALRIMQDLTRRSASRTGTHWNQAPHRAL